MNFVRYICTLIAGAALALCSFIGIAVADTIKIGSFLAVTGPASFLGDPEKKTLELYVDKINEQGGINGKQVELTLYDTGLDAKEAVTFVKRLISEDQVDIIVGGTTTGETMAVLKEIEKAGIPFISLAGASVIIDPPKKWVFKTPHTDAMAVGMVYNDMKKEGISKIGLIAGAGGFDKSCMKNAQALAEGAGISIAIAETYGKGDNDMTPQLTKIKNAGVDATLFCGFGGPSSIVTKNYAQLGIEGPLYHTHGSCSKGFIKGAGDAANGVRLPCAALLVADQLPDDDPQKTIGMDYIKAYTDKYGSDVSTFGGHAYDALFIAVEALTKAGTTDKAKVRDAIEATENFIGVDGIFNMSESDHMGLSLDSFKMLEVENGNWKYLY
ncbi:MAG: ABC transporter substrate-binding protein [Arenicellales bacterium]|nr:ABC transporter substrate-binding protein [Arenicellales bacterium]